ncbi:MAG: hypothetical protein UU88_C0009G0025 [Parcubacteria group bacterium GW2011_GWC1_42_11]|uniref:Permease n=1 Tax=Candidatus Nomurabacteria bacterium GW2011_GWC2_42_20 TaxID=1618756 RepID=A0A0G1CDL5_9BACT|nr:MAG: hypothetical protein UU88_C0009G0025 [Parcubacteria group bacterium GW2011_GWC1_42_11]KKS47728.1 MAG: hypothetical protein UV12_C0005G0003 [Candidatus Nomurabacteria bacterium GW2011_GWC2_42_20]KKT08635.1 MAG: hypothetical protein UV86_C0017G0009 [Candidatus Nomurabacteria bacterium GW2011_GWB1_43_20]TAN36372.1 MAG: hypothetical protein EPN27_01860 [Patescibacteria group bacterium]HBH71622.1 hypothetical protein [Candidatus Yonathbacteria bacterium]
MEKDNIQSSPATKHPHYYGNLIRKQLFFAAFVIMIAALIDSELRNFYLFIGLFGVVGFTILAGLTSPQKRGIMFTDVLVSSFMFLIFEYFAISAFIRYEDFSDPVFFFRQLIAVIYLVILYYSTKTLRYYDDAEGHK